MAEPTRKQPPRRPQSMDPSAKGALSFAGRQLQLGELTIAILSPELRRILEARRSYLAGEMRCGTSAEIADALATLVLVMGGSSPQNPELAKRTAELVTSDLADVPLWALWEATVAFRRGDIGDGKYRPKPGQLRKEAQRRAMPYEDEATQIDKVLAAPVIEEPVPADLERRKMMAQRLRAMGIDASLQDRDHTKGKKS